MSSCSAVQSTTQLLAVQQNCYATISLSSPLQNLLVFCTFVWMHRTHFWNWAVSKVKAFISPLSTRGALLFYSNIIPHSRSAHQLELKQHFSTIIAMYMYCMYNSNHILLCTQILQVVKVQQMLMLDNRLESYLDQANFVVRDNISKILIAWNSNPVM